MKITILHNAVAESDSAAECDVLVQVAAVEQSLHSLGHQARRLACTLDLEAVEEALTADRPEVVFNLVESLGGSDRFAHLVAMLLEDLDLPYTGTRAAALHLASNKPRAKEQLRAAGLPTPDWAIANEARSANEVTRANGVTGGKGTVEVVLSPPYIIKAVWEHASVGIDDHAIVWNGDGSTVCDQIASRSRQLGQTCFAEQFIDGREFNLSLIATNDGPLVLPPAEIDFAALPPDKPRIVGYAAKWEEGSAEFSATPRRFEFAEADAPLLDRLRGLAMQCWELFDMRGFARVDFRVDKSGQPWILEVNANPCLSPDAGFAAALERENVPLTRAVEWIVEDAVGGFRVQGSGFSRGQGARDRGQETGDEGQQLLTKAKRRRRPAGIKLREEVKAEDCQSVQEIVAATGLFRAAEIDVAMELVEARLEKGAASGYEFLFAEQKGKVIGYTCFGKNTLTVSSYDVYWIAVEPSKQEQGVGRLLLAEAERQIAAAGGTRIYIDTSHRSDYQATRGFYEQCGYTLAAVLDDFFAPGDGKATYVKVVGASLSHSMIGGPGRDRD